jgi:hypothetical protein
VDDDQTVLMNVFELEWLLEQSANDAPAKVFPPACNWNNDHMSVAVYLREAGVAPTPAAIEAALKHARTFNAMDEAIAGYRAACQRWGAPADSEVEYECDWARYDEHTIRPRRGNLPEDELLERDLRQNEWHR